MIYNPLLLAQECIKMLGASAVVLSKKETDKQWDLLKRMVPFTHNGKVLWERVVKKQLAENNAQDILDILQNLLGCPIDNDVYIQWSDDTLPVVKTDLDNALSFLDSIRKVTFEVFLFNPRQGYLIEILSNQVTVGLIKNSSF
jgi:hypothetical protein